MRLHDSAYAGVAISIALGVTGGAAVLCFIAALLVPIVARCRHDRALLRAQCAQRLQNQEAPPIAGYVDYVGATTDSGAQNKSDLYGGSEEGGSSPLPPKYSNAYAYATQFVRCVSAISLAFASAFTLLFFAVLSGFSVVPPAVAIIIGLLAASLPLLSSFWFLFAFGKHSRKEVAETDEIRSVAGRGGDTIHRGAIEFSPPVSPSGLGSIAGAGRQVSGVANFTDIGGGSPTPPPHPHPHPSAGGDTSTAESDTSSSTLRRRTSNNNNNQQTACGGFGGSTAGSRGGDRPSTPVALFISRVLHEVKGFTLAVKARCGLFLGAWVVPFVVVAFLFFFLLWDVCFCSTPFAVSTYVSRAGQRYQFCPANQHCHLYPMMGLNSSVVRLVGHVKIDGSERRSVESAWVDICEVSAPQAGTTLPHVNTFDFSEAELLSNNLEKFVSAERLMNALPCVSTPRIVRSSLIDYSAGTTGGEDLRYISHTYLDGLDPLKFYKVQSHFIFQDGATLLQQKQGEAARREDSKLFPSLPEEYGAHQTSRTLIFRTLPAPTDVSTNVNFISGGDYGTRDSKGKALMGELYKEEPDVHFIHIGGDISYSNNMRSCYLRVDRTVFELTNFRTKAHGAAVPLHVLVGNHETGGYERVARRWDRLNFQQQYFPIFDGDTSYERVVSGSAQLMPHETYHKHIVSGLLGMVSLDSGCQIHPRKQVPYLEESLSYMHGGWAPSGGGGALPPPIPDDSLARFVIVTYHNPAFPSLRKFSDPQASAVRESFLPLVERFKVPMVLEFHDHVYKRTHPVHVGPTGELRTDVEEDKKAHDYSFKGTVYIGDGGVGLDRKTPGVRDPASSRFQAAFAEASNVQLIRVNKSRIAEVLTYTNGNRKIIDEVKVGLRSG